MTGEELIWYNEFEEAAYLNNQYTPWTKRREAGLKLCRFSIIDCSYEYYWYKGFIGIEYLGVLNHMPYSRPKEIHPIKLTRTKMTIGRSIPLIDISIL